MFDPNENWVAPLNMPGVKERYIEALYALSQYGHVTVRPLPPWLVPPNFVGVINGELVASMNVCMEAKDALGVVVPEAN